jgi:hypothetical protein
MRVLGGMKNRQMKTPTGDAGAFVNLRGQDHLNSKSFRVCT